MGKERKDKEFSAGEQEIQAVFARLCPLVTDALSLEKCELKLSDRPADLGADSLDVFQIIMGIEEEFDIEIPNDAAEQIVTVGDAVEQIKAATN